jgi:DNA-binding XRE family transcriptional regulator
MRCVWVTLAVDESRSNRVDCTAFKRREFAQGVTEGYARRMDDTTPEGPTGLGARLRQARGFAGQTQETLADAVGVTRPAVARYEAGTSGASLETVWAMARALGVRAGWLAFGEAPVLAGRRG